MDDFKKEEIIKVINAEVKIVKMSEAIGEDVLYLVYLIRKNKRDLLGILYGKKGDTYPHEYVMCNDRYVLISSVINISDYSSFYPHVCPKVEITLYDSFNDEIIHSYDEANNNRVFNIFNGKDDIKNIKKRELKN